MGLIARLKGAERSKRVGNDQCEADAAHSRLVPLPEDDFLKVVGESHYQSALVALARVCVDESDGRPAFRAELLAEPENPFDSSAIAVHGPTGQLGYLARDNASRFARAFKLIHAAGYSGASCTGLLNGGDIERPSYGVVLRLAYPETCEGHLIRFHESD